MPICFRLLTQWARRAASRADCTAGSRIAINTPMIVTATSSSMSVKPGRACARGIMAPILARPGAAGLGLLDPLDVLAGAGVDADLLARLDERRHLDLQ